MTFRRTGATLINALGVLSEVAERCLNHVEENKIKRIYMIQLLLKLVWLYSEQTDSSIKSMVAQELAMFEAGMKLEASRRQRIEAARKERPWPALDQWIRQKPKLKTEWTNEKLWAALPF